MNKFKLLVLSSLLAGNITSQIWEPQNWPVLKQYDQQHLYQIALPLGGIGTGTVSLGGRGELRDWEIMNVPAKNTVLLHLGIMPHSLLYILNQKKERLKQLY